MKTRLLAMGAAVFVAATLAACGGGGGGGGGTPPPPPPTGTPTPVSTPTLNPYGCVGSTPYARIAAVNPPHPIAPGDTFSYTGSISHTYTQSEPCAQPTATSAATVSSSVTASATTLPNGNGPGRDVKTAESDAYPTLTSTTTTDQSVRNTASAYQLFAVKAADTSSNVMNVIYTNPQQIDQLPEAPAQPWSNDPASTTTENLADGVTVSRTTASDGSFIDTENFPGGLTNVITVNGAVNAHPRDGSGTYALNGSSLAFSAPSAGTITMTQGSTNQTFPAWFTLGASFNTDSFVDNGSQSFDAGCGVVPPAFGTSGNQIVESHTVTDPVVGYQEIRTTTSYVVSGYGAVCVKINDVLNSYYDFQRDLPKAYFSLNGQPNSVDTFVEFLTMTAPLTPYPAARTASATMQAVSPLTVAQHTAAIDLKRAVEREQRVRAMHDYFSNLGKGAVQ